MGFRVQGSGFGVWDLGLGFGVQGLGSRISDSGSGVFDSESRILGVEATPLMERENGITWNMKWKLGYTGPHALRASPRGCYVVPSWICYVFEYGISMCYPTRCYIGSFR